MKTNVEQVATMLQLMHNQARLIIQERGEVAFNIWKPMRIFLKDEALFVSDDTECTLFTQRPVVDQAMILDHLIEQIKCEELIIRPNHQNNTFEIEKNGCNCRTIEMSDDDFMKCLKYTYQDWQKYLDTNTDDYYFV